MNKFLLTLGLVGIVKLASAQVHIINTVAGSATVGFAGDGGQATTAELRNPEGVAFDGAGNMYIADAFNNRIRMVTPAGVISTVAGNGTASFSGDGGQATDATLNAPRGVTFDASGNMYIADFTNSVVRMVTQAGVISTVAGNNTTGFNGDGGQATAAALANPSAITFDGTGNMYIADYNNSRVRMVDPTGVISTFAGTSNGYSGDGGQATDAQLFFPAATVFDASGNLYIADYQNNRVRMVDPTGVISTFAGAGVSGGPNGAFGGDGGQATAALLWFPSGLAIDALGNVYISDHDNNRIRVVNTAGIINTYAGGGSSVGSGGLATAAQLDGQYAICFDPKGNLVIADNGNGLVRTVYTQGAALNFDGADDYVSVPDNAALDFGLNDFTIEADFQSSVSQTNYAGVVVKSFNGSDGFGGYQLVVVNNNIAAEFTDGNGNSLGTGNGLQGTSTITDGNWHHLTMVVNRANNNIKLLVDGNVEADVTDPIVSITNVSNPVENMLIGVERTYAIHTNANIDEVRIWNRALCQAEIQNNLNGELPASATGLVAYYKFNQGLDNSDNTAITTLTDATSNSLTGTLTNFALTGTTSNFIAAGAVTTGNLVTAFTNTLSAVATQTNVACNGNANGTASVTASGITPYSYSWSSGGSTTNSATGLAAGNYTCTINNGCGTITQTITITEPTLLAASSTSGTIACNGGATTVSVSATGGTLTYSNTGTFTVTAGSYTYTVTDANNCTATTIASVTEPTLLVASSTSGTIACNGGATSMTVTATGGTPFYSGDAGTFTVTAGSYTYNVTDANLCASTTTITVTEPTILAASSTSGTIACNGGATTVSVTATGGTPTYSNTGTFTVTAGSYTYTVADANNCTATTIASVTEPTILAASSTSGTIACNGATTTVSVSATGGTPLYTGTGTFTATAGSHTYTVTDNNSCTATTMLTLTQPAAITYSQSPIICTSGYVIVGTHLYTTAATYTDVIKTSKGCDSTVITKLTVSKVKAIFVDSFPSCACNSTVYFSDSSSVTAGDPIVAWHWTIRHSGSAVQTSTLQNPQFVLGAGTNNVCFKVTTQSGCIDSTCSIVHQSITGVQEFQNPTTLSIYPNPTQGNFTIETNLTEKQNLDVYDVNGKLVYTQTIIGTTNINAVVLAPGVYNVSLTNNYGIINKRLVILNK